MPAHTKPPETEVGKVFYSVCVTWNQLKLAIPLIFSVLHLPGD